MNTTFTQKANEIFVQSINDYHVKDDIETPAMLVSDDKNDISFQQRLFNK